MGPASEAGDAGGPGSLSLGHRPDGPWEFDQAVADCFDDMLRRSVPAYGEMRQLCREIGGWFCRPGTTVLDLGTSRGDALASFADAPPCADLSFVGLEVSEPMLEAARARFAGRDDVQIRDFDMRRGWPVFPNVSLTLAVLTLQFIPVNYRPGILGAAYAEARKYGAIILVEKVLGSTDRTEGALVQAYHRRKVANGYSVAEVNAKAASLEGVLVPLTASANEQMLRDAGWSDVECFWRWGNFAAWMGVKR